MTQEISEALGMKTASNHLDDLEAIESADHIGQEAPKFLLMLLLSPVARNSAAARGSGWPPSYRSDPTPLGRYRAAKVLDDGFVSPTHDDGAIYPYPDEAD